MRPRTRLSQAGPMQRLSAFERNEPQWDVKHKRQTQEDEEQLLKKTITMSVYQ